MRGWLTPDAIPVGTTTIAVVVPDGAEYRAALRGALLLLQEAFNWEQFGAKTPEEIAEAWLNANSQTFDGGVSMGAPGDVIFGGWSNPPTGYLLCNGSSYSTVDYPSLFAAIGYTFGGSGGAFNVPDLRKKFPLGVSYSNEIGLSGGYESVVLQEANLPPHTHGTKNTAALFNVSVGSGTIDLWKRDLTSEIATTSTGSGAAHPNMPPYLYLNSAIKT